MAAMSKEMEMYFDTLNKQLNEGMIVANKARSKGADPIKQVDILLAANMAERVVGLISVLKPELKETKIVERIYELEKQYGSQDWRVALTIAVEIASGKFCQFKTKLEAAEVGIRVGFAYITNGVVASPLEGFTKLEVKKRSDGESYFCAYFSGPVRSAGGTAASVSLLIIDYVRKKLGYKEYDITEEELKRAYTEISDYHERVTNLQYFPSEEEFLFMLRHLPVQVDGDPSEKFEVSNYKDLPRIKTNKLRNGPCLVLCEGICQKAPKVWKKVSQWGKDFELEHWNFLGEFVELQKKIRAKDKVASTELIKPDYNYIKDLVAGRPVLGHPLREGGFRLRYGRCRNSGFSSTAIHPATMIILKSFIGIGCQLKVERPGKATSIATCDSIEGPIVKLKNGNVLFVNDVVLAKKLVNEVEEILYLGDILINYGDFLNRAHILIPCGYNEEWYGLEVEKALKENNLNASDFGLNDEFFRYPNNYLLNFDQILDISKRLKVPLHPFYTYHWKALSKEMLLSLVDWLLMANIEKNKIIFPMKEEYKRNLEVMGVPHLQVGKEYVVIDGDFAKAFALSLGFYSQEFDEDSLKEVCSKKEDLMDIINSVSEVIVRDKHGTFIGARMGRPEKGKMRKLTTSPHILFPVGSEGGRLRSFQSAVEKGRITAEFPVFYCEKCNKEEIYARCTSCNSETNKSYYCEECKKIIKENTCARHGECKGGRLKSIDIKSLWDNCIKQCTFSEGLPDIVKGVRGTSNRDHHVEHLMKGILRAKNRIYVNRDGTTRFDMTELVATHFRPKEIGLTIEKLKQLGYTKDIFGREVVSNDQIIEMKLQDLILPKCLESKDEGADEVLFRVGNFIDDLLKYLYHEEPFYNFKKKEDLIGQIVIGLSPHTSAGIVGRIIGFSDCQGLVAHPMFHSIMRRDCLHPNTKFVLFDADKKEIYYNSIGGYVENLLKEGSKTRALDSYGTKKVECKNNLYVFGVDSVTKQFVRKRVKYFVKGPVEKRWVKITTETNKELVMTLNHKFLYLDDGDNFSWKRASEITAGDKLPILNKLNLDIEPQMELNVLKLFLEKVPRNELSRLRLKGCESFFREIWLKNKEFIHQIWGKKGNIKRWCTSVPLTNIYDLLNIGSLLLEEIPTNAFISNLFSNYRFPIKIKVTKELMRIIGYYIAEGYSRESKTVNQVAFRVCNKTMQIDLIAIIEKTFECKVNLGEENSKITICHKPIYYFFVYCLGLGKNAYSKRLPVFVYSLPKDLVCEVVGAYLDGDGSVIDSRSCIVFYSVCRSLLDDFALLLSKYGLVSRFSTTKARLPGRAVLLRYKELGLEPKSHILHHLVYSGEDCLFFKSNIQLRDYHKIVRLKRIKSRFLPRRIRFNRFSRELRGKGDILIDYVKKVEFIKDNKNSYCLDVDCKNLLDRNLLLGEQIINMRCDGDEACLMLLMDGLLNFSNAFLPEHRGGRQDEPLVLSTQIIPNEVDDMVFDMDVAFKYPLEFYEAASKFKFPWDVKIDKVGFFLGTEKQYEGYGFTHDTSNINLGNLCSSYKLLPTMEEKVYGQMDLAKRIRSVDEDDVARLVLERHFIRDIKGNLRKFSTQQFRCVNCNEKFRRPPLQGNCTKCNGRLLFTVAEGSVVKYLEPSLSLIEKYKIPAYLKQTVELTKMRIESVFGKEADKQVGLGKWFKS